MNPKQRFHSVMDYAPADGVPNHELGVWAQTVDVWRGQGAPVEEFTWDWFTGEDFLGLDPRRYFPTYYGMTEPFAHEILGSDDRYEIFRDGTGIVHKALKEGSIGGARMCMDQYISFPVVDPGDFKALKTRYGLAHDKRLPLGWEELAADFSTGSDVTCLWRNCAAGGFYWRAREWMGTENLSYAWYDYPDLMDEMMEFIADLIIGISRPVLERTGFDYVVINEDLAMKNGPLLSPATFRRFIFPHLERVVRFLKGNGVKYVLVDSDGNPEAIIPHFMDAGIDGIWPLERASDVDPIAWRRKFGRDLRMWGGVDKRILAQGPGEIDRHMAELAPLLEDGGFIPTVDHTVPPDVPWRSFLHYMEVKRKHLAGAFGG